MKKADVHSRIVNPLTYSHLDTMEPVLWKRSLTVPDMVMPLSEVIQRYTRGQAVPTLPAVYADIDLSPYDDLDKFQIIDLQRKLEYRSRLLKNDIELTKNKIRSQKEKAEYDARVAAAAKALSQSQNNDNKTQTS